MGEPGTKEVLSLEDLEAAGNIHTGRKHVLSVLVENKAGVLTRVASLFARRGFNIYSLAVAPTDDERFSRITVVVDVESAPLEQITKQLFKLINVVKIVELDPEHAVERELMLMTIKADPKTRGNVIELVQVFGGKIVDVGHDELTVELAGAPAKLDDLEELMRPFGITELQRTGRVALPKLERQAPRLRSLKGMNN
jgi:acetolactate synthase-1/3 small subunit